MNLKELEDYCVHALNVAESTYVWNGLSHDEYLDIMRSVLSILKEHNLLSAKEICVVPGCQQEAKYTADGNKVCYVHRGVSFCVVCNAVAIATAAHIPVCELHWKEYKQEAEQYLDVRPVWDKLQQADRNRK